MSKVVSQDDRLSQELRLAQLTAPHLFSSKRRPSNIEAYILQNANRDYIVTAKKRARHTPGTDMLMEHFNMLQRATKTGTWEIDNSGGGFSDFMDEREDQLIYCSREVYNILGLAPESADISKDFFVPQLDPYDMSLLLQNAESGSRSVKKFREEHTVTTKDGRERMLLKMSDIIFDPVTGAPARVLGTVQDVTELRGLQQEVQDLSRSRKMLAAHIFDAYLSFDISNRIIELSNNTFRQMFEQAVIQTGSKHSTFLSFIPAEERQPLITLVRKLKQYPVVHYDFSIECRDGSRREIHTRIIPAFNKAGRLARIEIIARDMNSTALPGVAGELQQDLRRQLFNAGEVVFILNHNLSISFVTDNVSQLLGYKAGALFGKQLQDLVLKQDHVYLSEFYNDLFTGRNRTDNIAAFRFTNASHKEVWCECEVYDLNNNPVINGVITRVRDITFSKKRETQLLERVYQLQQNKAGMDYFMSVVSHDLKAPLSSIKGILMLMEMENEEQHFSEEIGYLKDSVQKMEAFIADMLDYTRSEHAAPDPQPVNFGAVIDEIVTGLKFMDASHKEIRFNRSINQAGQFYSDRQALRIIFNNLISNAIRYSNPKAAEPFVSVRISTFETGANIEVWDNGIGIPAEHHAKIFDQFYRVSADKKGTGLGLHLVKKTVEKLSGHISLESAPGAGSRFFITLPNMK